MTRQSFSFWLEVIAQVPVQVQVTSTLCQRLHPLTGTQNGMEPRLHQREQLDELETAADVS